MLTKELIANVKRLEIRTRRIVDEITAGAYHSVFKGRGMEFDEVREYAPGDDVRAIDWNVTARMGHPFVKRFVEERELTVMLLVDVSASTDFGSTSRRKKALAAELAALLAFSAIRNNDQVGLLMFTDQSELFVAPRKGRKHVLRLIRDLLAQRRTKAGTDISAALETLMKALKRRAIVFLISDMLDDGFESALRSANRRHDVVVLRLSDPRDMSVPKLGFVSVEGLEKGAARYFGAWGARARRKYQVESVAIRLAQDEICRRAKADLIDLRCGEDAIVPLMRFFRTRERRR